MNVEIINVGTELLLGEIVNTNATYLQKMCKELGFNVFFQTSSRQRHKARSLPYVRHHVVL